MLLLTRLGGPVFALNPDLIERAEATPDTVITLVNGSKYVVRETLDELAQQIRAYRAQTAAAAYRMPMEHRAAVPQQSPTPSEQSCDATVVEFRRGDT